jgi:RNA polymerase sigma factor (sigma-70 family)
VDLQQAQSGFINASEPRLLALADRLRMGRERTSTTEVDGNNTMEQWMSLTGSAVGLRAQSTGENKPATASDALDFRAVYDQWFERVSRWICAMGGPAAEREDLIQDVFVVVHRRLPYFEGNNLAGWLYQIARHRVRDFRRLVWVRQIRAHSAPLTDSVLKDRRASPAETCETEEKRETLERLLNDLSDAERTALVLFEIDGYSGEEIAALQRVPLNTVWSRIYKARRKLKLWLTNSEKQRRSHAC